MRSARIVAAASLVSVVLLCALSDAFAQSAELQSRMATAFDIVCRDLGRLSPPGPTPSPLTGEQQTLLANCGVFQGLGAADQATALESLSPNQSFNIRTNVTETSAAQFALVASRLFSLRQGASGISMQGLRLLADAMPANPMLATLSDAGNGGSALPGALGGKLGVFVTGSVNWGDRDSSTREPGFDFVTAGMAAGVDYRVLPNLVMGLAFTFQATDADVDGIIARIGDVETRSYGLSTYGTFYAGRAYVDWQLGAAWNTYDTSRRIAFGTVNTTAEGDTDGQQYMATVGGGYEFPLGATRITPYGRVDFVQLEVDGFRERDPQALNLDIESQSIPSLRSALGARVSHSISTPFAVLLPQVHAEWVHQFLDDRRSIEARFVNDPIGTRISVRTDRLDRDYGAIGAGISAVFARGITAFVQYETLVGLRDITSHAFTGGARVEF
jgi:outer membrane autotransporter protein